LGDDRQARRGDRHLPRLSGGLAAAGDIDRADRWDRLEYVGLIERDDADGIAVAPDDPDDRARFLADHGQRMTARWPYVVVAIVLIVIALEAAPTIGGLLLVMVVLAALLHAAPGTLAQTGSTASSVLTGI
jgi:hypothetical protein